MNLFNLFRKTIEQRRLAVLKDAVAQLKADRYLASIGHVFRLFDLTKLSGNASCEARPILRKNVQCEVCARGALLVSRIRLENEFKVGDLRSVYGAYNQDGKTDSYLSYLFDREQLALMENAYEINSVYPGINHKVLPFEAASESLSFGFRYRDRKERLLAIFQNAIRNGGIFKP